MLSLKNKKQNGVVFALALFLFSSGVFFFDPAVARADWFWNFPANAAAAAGDAVSNVFKGLLYGIFLSIGLLTSVAVIIFEWAINPDYISGPSGLLNSSSVYDMWKFVRDFFNLFFILTLLYTAFTIVFQVAKDYKKTLLSLVLAALFVNFSFPITRVIIDVTNVPMYYFINQIGAGKDASEGKLGSMLSASQLKGILVPGAENGGTATMSQVTVSRLLLAIIFIFMFTVSLLVLAVMFVVRLVALVMLLIFSSVGFAASVIPGMQKYGEDWWNYLSKYALFGPAAALMLFVSTRFFQEIAKNDTKTQFLQSGVGNAVQSDVDFIASMAMFVLPIIMLWMAIGMASSMSIIGAGAVVGMGQSVIRGAGKKFSGYNWAKRNATDYAASRKKRTDEINKTSFGRSFGKLTNKFQDTVYGKAKYIPGSASARERIKDMHNQEVADRAKMNKENGVNNSTLRNQLKSNDKVEAAAAAMTLSERKAIHGADEFALALQALGNNTKAAADLIKNTDAGDLDIDSNKYRELTGLEAFKNADGQQDEELVKMFNGQLKDKGKVHVLIDNEVDKIPPGASDADREAAIQKAVTDAMKGMKSAKQVAASEGLFKDARYRQHAVDYVNSQGPDRVQAIKKVSADEGTSVGQYFTPRPPVEIAEDPEEIKKKEEAKRIREKIQARAKETQNRRNS